MNEWPNDKYKWSQWLAKMPDLATLNEYVAEISELEQADKQPVWNMVHRYATQRGWTFDKDSKTFK